MTAEDNIFLKAFEECTLPKTLWTHEAHLRMAWLRLREKGFSEGLRFIKNGIRRYNDSLAASGYHETVTVAFAALVHYRSQLGSSDWNFSEFIAHNSDLLAKSPAILNNFYSRERLAQSAARDHFEDGDLRPLPAVGICRDVKPDEAETVLAIYEPYVRKTPVTFEISVPSVTEFRQRIVDNSAKAPWLVYEVNGEIAGYAYASEHRKREAYSWVLEASVYVADGFQRRGVARLLYTRLFDLLRRQGRHLVLAGIALPNASSVSLHESLGFERVALYPKIGFKLGEWHDVGWWQKRLRPVENPAL